MFDEHHYVPILKGRAGEYGALGEADERVRGSMTPLIEIAPVPWDFEDEQPAKSTAAHVAPAAQHLENAWGIERRLFLDAGLLAPDDLIDGRHPLGVVLDAARDHGLLTVPVWGPKRGLPYIEAVRQAVASDERGACLRLESEDLEEPEELAADVAAALEQVGVSEADVDLVIDLGPVAAEHRWTGATVRLAHRAAQRRRVAQPDACVLILPA